MPSITGGDQLGPDYASHMYIFRGWVGGIHPDHPEADWHSTDENYENSFEFVGVTGGFAVNGIHYQLGFSGFDQALVAHKSWANEDWGEDPDTGEYKPEFEFEVVDIKDLSIEVIESALQNGIDHLGTPEGQALLRALGINSSYFPAVELVSVDRLTQGTSSEQAAEAVKIKDRRAVLEPLQKMLRREVSLVLQEFGLGDS